MRTRDVGYQTIKKEVKPNNTIFWQHLANHYIFQENINYKQLSKLFIPHYNTL